MRYGEQTGYKNYYKKSLTKAYKSKITNEEVKNNIKAIWLEHNEEDDEDYIYIYFADDQEIIWNVYDETPMISTQVPNWSGVDDIKRINDWLDEISYVKEG